MSLPKGWLVYFLRSEKRQRCSACFAQILVSPFFCEHPQVIHQFPSLRFREAILPRRHRRAAGGYLPKKFSVRGFLHHLRVCKVRRLLWKKSCRRPIAGARLPMAYDAVLLIEHCGGLELI